MLQWRWEINLGTVVEIVTVLIAVFGAVRKLGALEAKVGLMYHWFEKHIVDRDEIRQRRRSAGE